MTSELSFELVHDSCNRAILLFHGLTGSPFEMKNYGKKLHKAGFDIFCPCLPGHGGSIEDAKKVKWQEWVSFSLEEYKKLKRKYRKVYVAGLCLGAVLAIAVAEEENIDGIAALSTTLFLDGWKMPWYMFLMPLGLYTILKYHYSFPESEPYGIKNEIIRKKISSMLKENTMAFDNIPLACIHELLRLSGHVRRRLSRVTAPILIIHSEYDDLTNIRGAKTVYSKVSSSVREFIKLQNCYHMLILDNEKELVTSKTIEFFNNLYNKTSSEILSEEENEVGKIIYLDR